MDRPGTTEAEIRIGRFEGDEPLEETASAGPELEEGRKAKAHCHRRLQRQEVVLSQADVETRAIPPHDLALRDNPKGLLEQLGREPGAIRSKTRRPSERVSICEDLP